MQISPQRLLTSNSFFVGPFNGNHSLALIALPLYSQFSNGNITDSW